MATRKLNRLATQVTKLTNPLPAAYKPWGYTFAFDMMVRPACFFAWASPSPSPSAFLLHLAPISHTHAHLVHNTRTLYR